jgi:hypothetical protein
MERDTPEVPVAVAEAESAVLAGAEPAGALEHVGPSPLRVIRGMGGTGLVWAGLWGTLGTGLSLVLSLTLGLPVALLVPWS